MTLEGTTPKEDGAVTTPEGLGAVLNSLGVNPGEFAGWAGVGDIATLGAYVTVAGNVTQMYAVSPHVFMLWEQTADNAVRQIVVVPLANISRVVYTETQMTGRLLIEMNADRTSGRVEYRSEAVQNLGAFAQDGAQEGRLNTAGEAVISLERAHYAIEAEEAKLGELKLFARRLIAATAAD